MTTTTTNLVAVWERTSGTNATIVITGQAPYRFRATAERHFARQLANLLAAMGVTTALEART